jgi:hypothetical protein
LSAIKTVEQAFEEVKQRIDEVVRKAWVLIRRPF